MQTSLQHPLSRFPVCRPSSDCSMLSVLTILYAVAVRDMVFKPLVSAGTHGSSRVELRVSGVVGKGSGGRGWGAFGLLSYVA